MSLPVPIPLEEAHARLLSAVEPLAAETIGVEKALGRYLTEPLLARRTQPAADLSAMDGYAMRADDLSGPWTVIGESAAGHPFQGSLQTGQAVRISTGALMPEGGGAVLLQEEALRSGDRLALTEGGEATPRHIRRRGFDFSEGDALLPAGERIGPPQVALALSAGYREIPAGKLPSVAILDSGDELASDPAACAVHQIPASNGAMLEAMVRPYAADVTRLGPVADTMTAFETSFARCERVDVLVTSGGASVGDHDLVRPALEAWGAQIDFWRVAMKPGKPLLIARRGRQWIVGLPGNPVSSYVTAYLFVLPLLRALAGASRAVPQAIAAQCASPLSGTGSRAEFVRSRWEGPHLAAVDEQDSSALGALSRAQALIYRAANSPPVEAGDSVAAYLLENGGIA